MRSDEVLLRLADVAEPQWGLFTSAQAADAGVTLQQLKRLSDKWLLQRVRHGVYRLAGAPESPRELIRAEWLALDPKRTAGERVRGDDPVGVVSHRSAARLLGLGDLDADVHEFTVPTRRGTRSRDVAVHVGTVDVADWRLVDGLPVTRPLRTIRDLARARTDGGHLASVVRDAILAGDAPIGQVETVLGPFAHHYGLRPGAGGELVDQLISEAGVPDSSASVVAAEMASAALAVTTKSLTESATRPLQPGLSGMLDDLFRAQPISTGVSIADLLRPIIEQLQPSVDASAFWDVIRNDQSIRGDLLQSDLIKGFAARQLVSSSPALTEAFQKLMVSYRPDAKLAEDLQKLVTVSLPLVSEELKDIGQLAVRDLPVMKFPGLDQISVPSGVAEGVVSLHSKEIEQPGDAEDGSTDEGE